MWQPVVVIALGLLLLVSCRPDKRPAHILSEEAMTRAIIDLYLAEAKLRNTGWQQDSAMQYFIPFEQKWLAEQNLSDTTLLTSYKYYLDHPTQLEKIYDAVIDSLSLREQKINNQTSVAPAQ